MDTYDEWNLLLLNEYFNEANCGESVWIQTSREELNSFGFRYGGVDGLIKAIKLGPSWCRDSSSHIAYTVWMLRNQRESGSEKSRPSDYGDPGNYSDTYKNLDAPTYLPYLALWVLAASEEGGMGFYDKVAQLSGTYFESSQDTRQTIWQLWLDLAEWSTLLDGQLGTFSAISLGAHTYVGLAKAQALLTQRDRKELPRLFAQQGLRPNQKLSDWDFQNLVASGQDQYYLSNGLREAFRDRSRFGDAVKEVLDAQLAEWEGHWSSKNIGSSSRRKNSSGTSFEANEASPEELLSLTVLLSQSFDGWEIGLRLNAHISGRQFKLRCSDEELLASIDPYRETIDCFNNTEAGQLAVWTTLEHASKYEDKVLEAEYLSETDDNSEISMKAELASVACHALAWTNTRHEQKLVEVPLPITGPVYLLTLHDSVKDELDSYDIHYVELMDEDREGLPENWRIFVVEKTEDLAPGMRSAIQRLIGDQSGSEGRPRIRFVSGCVIMRGGSRQFVDYDLPLVEVEMPKGAVIKSEGLHLENIEEAQGDNATYSEFYRIERLNRSLYQYTINVSLRSEILCSAKLKIAPSSVHANPHRAFSIGKFGDSLGFEEGLKGITLGRNFNTEQKSHSVDIMTDEMRKCFLLTLETFDPRTNLACLFLDLIAQKGSIPFGDAKRLVGRLVQRLQTQTPSLYLLLFGLRSLGYLDLETDQKGHLLRIHSAPVTIYRIGHDDTNGDNLWSVSGTPILEQWESLVTTPYFDVYITDGLVPSLRISSHSIEAVVEELRADLLVGVSDSILSYSASLDDFKEMLLAQYGYEQYRPKNLQRLQPEKAQFNSDRSGLMKVDEGRSCELFKLDDPIISKMEVYMLGTYSETGNVYSFIPDSRWAVWLAITSFVEMLYQKYGRDDAYPWPLCYETNSKDLIIPARMKPPMLIDRAICVASGQTPDELLCKVEAGSKDEEGFTLYSVSNTAFRLPGVPNAYLGMADGRWLRYRLVSKALAENVAQKLSCYVHYLS